MFVRTSSTRSRAPAKPAPRLSPPRPYLRAALTRRPRPDRSGKSRPGHHKAPEPGGHSQPEGSVSCLRAVSAAAVVASADLARSRRRGAATPVGRSIHAIPSGVQLTATVDGNPAVSSPTSPDAARHDSHVTDLRGRQPTHCLALRIRRLGVRVPPSAALIAGHTLGITRSRSLMTPARYGDDQAPPILCKTTGGNRSPNASRPGTGPIQTYSRPSRCLALRIKRLGVRVPPSAPHLRRSEAWDHPLKIADDARTATRTATGTIKRRRSCARPPAGTGRRTHRGPVLGRPRPTAGLAAYPRKTQFGWVLVSS